MIKDVGPLLKECEETLAELKKIGNIEVACYVQGFINSINKLPEAKKPLGECGTCKYFVKGGLDGNTYVCEHPRTEREDYYDYTCLEVNEKDFCSSYKNYESKEGEKS